MVDLSTTQPKSKRSRWYNRSSSTTPLPTHGNRSTVPTGIPLPPPSVNYRARPRHEPSRTTKTAPKTVLFPEGEGEEAETGRNAFVEGALPDVSPQLPSITDELSDETDKLKRVSAWLIAESLNFHSLIEDLNARKGSCLIEPTRFDEVVHTPYSVKRSLTPNSPNDKKHEEVTAEVFFFDYGVIVIWGLQEEEQERTIINEFITRHSVDELMIEDQELEQFKYLQDSKKPPRLYNDVIWLRTASRLVKLTISHALAQSVKLTYFEGLVETTILATKDIPYSLASTGNIAMSRKAITRQIGELLITRINVNLVSNVLDAPEIFWSQPTYLPLYQSVRGYLEIGQRVDVLNQRCAVISDMLDLLREHANSIHAEYLEWIIIVLITIEILLGLIEICINFLTRS